MQVFVTATSNYIIFLRVDQMLFWGMFLTAGKPKKGIQDKFMEPRGSEIGSTLECSDLRNFV